MWHFSLSLWWQTAGGCRLTKEQESLAQAVFFDLVEAVHDVPPMYAADYNAASGAPAAAAPAADYNAASGAASGQPSAPSGSGHPAGSRSGITPPIVAPVHSGDPQRRIRSTAVAPPSGPPLAPVHSGCSSGSADRESCADTAKPWHMAHDGCWKAGT